MRQMLASCKGVCEGVTRTVQFGELGFEVIVFVEDSSAALFDKGVESCCELGHALAQVFEWYVNGGQLCEVAASVGEGRLL